LNELSTEDAYYSPLFFGTELGFSVVKFVKLGQQKYNYCVNEIGIFASAAIKAYSKKKSAVTALTMVIDFAPIQIISQ
jgi:hypothetical protein